MEKVFVFCCLLLLITVDVLAILYVLMRIADHISRWKASTTVADKIEPQGPTLRLLLVVLFTLAFAAQGRASCEVPTYYRHNQHYNRPKTTVVIPRSARQDRRVPVKVVIEQPTPPSASKCYPRPTGTGLSPQRVVVTSTKTRVSNR